MCRKLPILFWALLGFFLISRPLAGPCQEAAYAPQIKVDARSAILVEASTEKVLLEQDADVPIGPASFTKMVTLYLVFEAIDKGLAQLDDEVWVSEQAWRTKGSRMFLEVDSRVPLEEVIKGIAVVSGNDACVAAAEHLYGSVDAFVMAMNRKVREMGLKNTVFGTPHGLSAEGQVTTARDMAVFAVAYMKRFPQALKYHSMESFTYNGITQSNRNRLLMRDESVDGLKTGYVEAAGYHLAATAQREGMRLLAVVMGASSSTVREREAMKLLQFGFQHYALLQPFPQNRAVATLKIWNGIKDETLLYPADIPALLVPRIQKDQLQWEIVLEKDVTAPVRKNQPLGRLVLYLGDRPEKTIPLVSQEQVAEAGWLKQIWHGLLRIHQMPWRWVAIILGGAVLFILVIAMISKRSLSRFRSHSRL